MSSNWPGSKWNSISRASGGQKTEGRGADQGFGRCRWMGWQVRGDFGWVAVPFSLLRRIVNGSAA